MDLQDLRWLRKLWLCKTSVRGSIKAVQNLKYLTQLSLVDTKVDGDLTAVQDLNNLFVLSLSNTNVEGDLRSIRNLGKLQELKLTNTKVEGSIAALQDLTSLKTLSLGNTRVTGEIAVVMQLDHLELLDLAGTAVTGWISAMWNGCCKKLRKVNLAGTASGPLLALEGTPEFFGAKPLLPALQILNVSGCQLNGSLADLLVPLADTPATSIAASGCGLSGAVPNLIEMSVRLNGIAYASFRTKLAQSLQTLDISANQLSSIASLPAALRVDLRQNAVPLKVKPYTLQEAVQRSIELWLDGTALQNPEDLQYLVNHVLRLRPEFAKSRWSFACRELVEPTLRVTPHIFMPEEMCACQAGFHGFATNCSPCPSDTYSTEPNSPSCQKCPLNSTSKNTSGSWQLCQCAFGSIHQDVNGLSCQCPAGEALVDTPGFERCEPCHKLRLTCPRAGSNASSAQVVEGHRHLQPNSHEVFACLDSSRCKADGCAAGYDGVLCSDCAVRHHSSHRQCKPCAEIHNMSAKRMVTLALCSAGVLVVLGAAMWTMRRRFLEVEVGLRWRCAAKLLVPQLAILLQLMQLWSVVGRLEQVWDDSSGNATEDVGGNDTEVQTGSDALVSYVEALQFTASELQGVFALQCIFDGALVRLASAIATPVVPLILLLACCIVEIFSEGTGIQIGLKILTVLFIGVAAGTAQLLACERMDGTGKAALNAFSFRPLMPHLLCTDASWVDGIGRACAVFYGMVIPCFLAYLFAKQHVVMRQSKTFVVWVDGDTKEVTLHLQVLSNEEHLKDHVKQKRLAAAAAAYIAVRAKKRARVSLKKGVDAVTVQILQNEDSADDIFDTSFTVDDLVSQDAAMLRSRAEILRYNAMVQMLVERTVLADLQSNQSDRIMMGARELLCKYVNCGFVWIEVCLKLASVVASKDGFWLSVAITLGMALVVGLAQPFMQPQLNALQTCCFLCLSLAALGFQVRRVWWLSRVALGLPVLLLSLLLLRPDSKEAMAVRLQEELETKLPEGPVEVSAEQVRFV